MKTLERPKSMEYRSITESKDYDDLLGRLYGKTKREIEEIDVPDVKIIAIEGDTAPASPEFQKAIECLYGVAYNLCMGLKFEKLPRPKGYFNYKVGGLESLWWDPEGGTTDVQKAKHLRWKLYLMVPAFASETLVKKAIAAAKAKKPDMPYDNVLLEHFHEGHAVQVLHVGPYDKEGPTIAMLHEYMKRADLQVTGKHHEIYISDPRRTAPEKLKTVIRYPASP